MTDREFIEKLEAYLNYEEGITPAMADEQDANPNPYADALAEQIGKAWEMCQDQLRGKAVTF